MSLLAAYKHFVDDEIRQAQFYMICRQTGIIFSSIVIARFLSVEEVGGIEMLMLCGYLMTFFWSDALIRGFLSTTGLVKDKESSSTFLWMYLIGGFLAMLVLFTGQKWLIPLFTSRAHLEGIRLFIFYQALIIPVWIAPFLGLIKGQNSVLLSLFVMICPAFACWTGFNSLPDINGVMIGLVCYAFVGFIWVLTKTKFIQRLRFRSLIVMIWPATWPLVMYAVSSGLARSFDAWLVARYFDESSFAIFRYGAREFPLVVALTAGFSTAMISRLLQPDGLTELKERSTRLMHMVYPILTFFILISPFAFEIIFGFEYRKSASIFNIYLLLALTQLFFPQTILTARRDSKLLWYVSIAELIVNVIASLLLMPHFGLIGIAIGTLIAFAFEKIVLLFLIHAKYKIGVSEIMDLRVWFLYVIILISAFILSIWMFGI
ncbi:MAG: polysaccharide biosynthesis C-terminal domain-containing protein [Bacteroidota bacterium]|nr:polysaccharide biosynthesis C-terminal domain-containing protein [Bacteroidota bacterium]